jgi:predicted hotdog family 3-hydroxylacyl-ACP dehydratase
MQADRASSPPLAELLPHEPCATLLDAVWIESPLGTRGRATVSERTLFHDEPAGWPAWLLVELMAQLIAAGAGLRSHQPGVRPPPGLLLGVRNLKCRQEVLPPGMLLEMLATESSQGLDRTAVYDCTVSSAGQVVAVATVMVHQPASFNDYLDGIEP